MATLLAPSVGGSIADGLTSGFNLGMAVRQQQRNNDRQDALDAQSTEQMQRNNDRQDASDQLRALDEQSKDLTNEGAAMASSSTPPTPDAQADYASRVSTVRTARSQHLAKMAGMDVAATQQQAKLDLDQISTMPDPSSLKPGQLSRAVTVATKRPPTDFVRNGDQPSPIEQAGQQFITGLQNNDPDSMLKGANFLYAPQLKVGVGTPSPHGGTIVGKQIVGFVPDPTSTADNPKVIPQLRVYVSNGQMVGPPGGGPGDNVPVGATGHYDAPLTQGRSTNPNDPVMSISMKDAMNYVGHNLHTADLLSQPGAMEALQNDQQSGAFDPSGYLNDYQTALSYQGVKTPKSTQKNTVIPSGGSVLRETVGPDGQVTGSQTIMGQPKPVVNRAQDVLQAKLDAIDDDDSLSDKERAIEKRAVLTGIKPGKYTGDGGGGGPGGPSAVATDRAADKAVGRQIQVLNAQREALSQDKKNAMDLLKVSTTAAGNLSGADAKAAQTAARAEYDKKVADISVRDTALQGRLEKLNEASDNATLATARPAKPGAVAAPASPGLGQAAPAGAPAPGAKRILKFDSNGKLIP